RAVAAIVSLPHQFLPNAIAAPVPELSLLEHIPILGQDLLFQDLHIRSRGRHRRQFHALWRHGSIVYYRATSCNHRPVRDRPQASGQPMLTSQRKRLILTRLAREGQIVAKEFPAELGTSEDTIRRDLRELSQSGKLQRVHGGALPASPAVANLQTREQVSPQEKISLGRFGASLVQAGKVVILDGGTTAIQVARHLDPSLRATIVTHSPNVAVELAA